MITFLSGGTGTPKLIEGFRHIIDDENIKIIANTADNFWVYGLYVAPDVDTVMYLFANLLDKKKYWGIKDDTFQTMDMLKRIRPEVWFNLGDKDLATHLFRTELIKKGINLSKITEKLCYVYNVKADIIPATDNHIETRIVTKEGNDLHFQEFWVKNKGNIEIREVYFKGINSAHVPEKAIKALEASELVIIGPSNPITSIGPIIKLSRIYRWLKRNKDKCIAISPIIADAPVSGPASKLMKASNVDTTVVGVAKIYSDIISTIFIDKADEKKKNIIEKEFDLKVYIGDIFFKTTEKATKFAKTVLQVMK